MKRAFLSLFLVSGCGTDLIQASGQLSSSTDDGSDSGTFTEDDSESGSEGGSNNAGNGSASGSGGSDGANGPTSDSPSDTTDAGSSDEEGSTGDATYLNPGDVCDPVEDLCVPGYACLFETGFVNQDPQQGTVWTWTCQPSGQPTEDTFLESCQMNSDCGQKGPCLPKELFPNGFCLEPSCCSTYCHVGENECGPGMFCFFVLSDYSEGSYTIPSDIGYCRSV